MALMQYLLSNLMPWRQPMYVMLHSNQLQLAITASLGCMHFIHLEHRITHRILVVYTHRQLHSQSTRALKGFHLWNTRIHCPYILFVNLLAMMML